MFGATKPSVATFDVADAKQKIKEVFTLFDKDRDGTVVEDEVPYILRYLGVFPTEKDLLEKIMPEIQEDEPSSFIKFDKFEKKVVELMQSGEYLPDTEDVLKQALRVIAKSLDPDGESKEKDTIEADALCDLLRRRGTPFREKEVENFTKGAEPEDGVIHIEDYLSNFADVVNKPI